MPDENTKPDLPDADTVYLHYLESFRRLGVVPVPRARASEPSTNGLIRIGKAMRREYGPPRTH